MSISSSRPRQLTGWRAALGKAHRRYSAFVNGRPRVTGHLLQSRFGSVVMDEDHLMAAARTVALNPAWRGLSKRAQDWPRSSVRAHLKGRNDARVDMAPLSRALPSASPTFSTRSPMPIKWPR